MASRSKTALSRTALLATIVLSLSSCGVQVSDELRAKGRGETGTGVVGSTSGGVPGGGGTTGATVDGSGTSGALAGATGASTGGTSGGGGGSATGGATGGSSTGTSGGSGGSATGAVPAPAGGNGGATDVGVTADKITVGSVTTLSGVVPGLFQGAVYGARAYFAYQNSLGGVYGRQLDLSVADDQLDCGQNRAQHLNQLPKVLGFVGSLSLYDNCGAEVLEKNKNVPDVSLALSSRAGDLPNNFSLAPVVPGYRLGVLNYYKEKFPQAVPHMASLVGNIGSAVEIWQGIKAAAESVGYHVDYERNFSPGETDFTADVIQMRQNGVRMIYFVAADSHTISRVLNTAAQQNWKPDVIAVGAGNAAYDPSFIAEAGAASEGMYADQAQALFFNPEDAKNIPGVARYQEWMNKIGQGKRTDLYSAWGWGSALLAVQGMKAAGPKLTRDSWLAAMTSIHTFDGDGMFAVSDPSSKKPTTCYLVMKVANKKFQRVDTPPSSYRCDGAFYYHKP